MSDKVLDLVELGFSENGAKAIVEYTQGEEWNPIEIGDLFTEYHTLNELRKDLGIKKIKEIEKELILIKTETYIVGIV
jgi:hypothetical protein